MMLLDAAKGYASVVPSAGVPNDDTRPIVVTSPELSASLNTKSLKIQSLLVKD